MGTDAGRAFRGPGGGGGGQAREGGGVVASSPAHCPRVRVGGVDGGWRGEAVHHCPSVVEVGVGVEARKMVELRRTSFSLGEGRGERWAGWPPTR